MSKLEYLQSELDKHIASFDKESTKHKNMHRCFRYSVFTLTGLSTVLAGLPVAFPSVQMPVSLLVLVTTATLAAVNSIEGLRRAAELWIHERSIFYELLSLRRKLTFQASEPVPPPDVDGLFRDMEDVLQSGRDRWNQMISAGGRRTVASAGAVGGAGSS
jgi:hypothetical protein